MDEQTLVIIKPDGVKRQLVGEIFTRFESANLTFSALKVTTLSKELLEVHYEQLTEQPYFPKLLTYMMSGPVVLMVVEGDCAVDRVRKIVGATDPLKASMGTLRADYGKNVTENLVHASDSLESAKREISRFFD